MINESKNIKNESINQITRDNVLALDIAEHCGYYSTHESGTWNFTQRKGKNATEQQCFMTHWLNLSKNTTSN